MNTHTVLPSQTGSRLLTYEHLETVYRDQPFPFQVHKHAAIICARVVMMHRVSHVLPQAFALGHRYRTSWYKPYRAWGMRERDVVLQSNT